MLMKASIADENEGAFAKWKQVFWSAKASARLLGELGEFLVIAYDDPSGYLCEMCVYEWSCLTLEKTGRCIPFASTICASARVAVSDNKHCIGHLTAGHLRGSPLLCDH